MVPENRDTIAVMTGGISGAFLGLEALLKTWIEKLEDHVYLEVSAEDLHRIFEQNC